MKEKINIIKIWSDSINRINLKNIIKDVKKRKKETQEKFIFISSGAVKLWKERISSFWLEEKDFLKSSLASIWQKFLMKLYLKYLWEKEIIGEVLIDDYANEEHLSSTLENLLKNDIWIIINHNDTLHPEELYNVSDKCDNDKNTVFITKLFNKYLDFKIKRIIYLTNTNWLLDEKYNTVSWWEVKTEDNKNYFRSFVNNNKSKCWIWWMMSKLNCWFQVLNYWVREAIIANAKDWLDCLESNKKCTKFIN